MDVTVWYRDPAWQFVGAVLGAVLTIAAIAVTLWLYFRDRKRLSYRMRVIPLLAIGDLAKRVHLIIDDNTVPEPHVVQVRIVNDGKVPIVPGDFSRPLLIPVDDAVAEHFVSGQHPESVRPSIKIKVLKDAQTRYTLSVEPLLLNPGDWFEVQMLTAGHTPLPVPEVRIAGVHSITPLRNPDGLVSLVVITFVTATVAILGWWVTEDIQEALDGGRRFVVTMFRAATITSIMTMVVTLVVRASWRWRRP